MSRVSRHALVRLASNVPTQGSDASEAAKETRKRQQAWARRATSMMFPWERAVLDGDATKPYTKWQKAYLAFAMLAIAALAWERTGTSPWRKKADVASYEAEQKRLEWARKAARGSLSHEEAMEAFDGMDPEAIDALVSRVSTEDRLAKELDPDVERKAIALGKDSTDGKGTDPFEGMSPEDIDRYVLRVREEESKRTSIHTESTPKVFRVGR